MTSSTVEQLNQATDAAGGEVVIKQPGATTSQRIAVATEAEILSPTADEPKLITNVGLNDKLEEFERQLGAHWGSWLPATPTSTHNNSTTDNTPFTVGGGVGTVRIRNSSSFNAKTTTFTGFVYALSDCTDRPTFSDAADDGAIIRGVLLFLADGKRWAYPVDNPEGGDAEEIFYLGSDNEWKAQPYDGSELETSFGGLPADGVWRPVTGVAHDEPNGPGQNALRDNLIIAKRDASTNTETAFSVAYSTDDNRTEFSAVQRTYSATGNPAANSVGLSQINATGKGANKHLSINDSNDALVFVTAASGGGGTPGNNSVGYGQINATGKGANKQLAINADNDSLVFVSPPTIPTQLPPTDGSVTLAKLNASAQGASKFLTINASNTALVFVDKPTPTVVEENITNISTPYRTSGVAQTLPSGKSFANYDFIIVKFSLYNYTYFSPMFAHKSSIGANERLIAIGRPVSNTHDAEKLAIDIRSNTTWMIATIGSGYRSDEGIEQIIGVKFQ